MQVVQKIQERRNGNGITIKVDGKRMFDVYDGEPEDNTLARNFCDCYSVVDLMKLAYEAGVRQEEFSLEVVDE